MAFLGSQAGFFSAWKFGMGVQKWVGKLPSGRCKIRTNPRPPNPKEVLTRRRQRRLELRLLRSGTRSAKTFRQSGFTSQKPGLYVCLMSGALGLPCPTISSSSFERFSRKGPSEHVRSSRPSIDSHHAAPRPHPHHGSLLRTRSTVILFLQQLLP